MRDDRVRTDSGGAAVRMHRPRRSLLAVTTLLLVGLLPAEVARPGDGERPVGQGPVTFRMDVPTSWQDGGHRASVRRESAPRTIAWSWREGSRTETAHTAYRHIEEAEVGVRDRFTAAAPGEARKSPVWVPSLAVWRAQILGPDWRPGDAVVTADVVMQGEHVAYRVTRTRHDASLAVKTWDGDTRFTSASFEHRVDILLVCRETQVEIRAYGAVRAPLEDGGHGRLVLEHWAEASHLRQTLDAEVGQALGGLRAELEAVVASVRLKEPPPPAEVSGRVTVPDPLAWTSTVDLPLIEVPVVLLQAGAVVGTTFTDLDGRYRLPLFRPGAPHVLRVALVHGLTFPPTIQVMHGASVDAVRAETAPAPIPPGGITVDLSFGPRGGLVAADPAYQARLQDLALVYRHAHAAIVEATVMLGQPLDLGLPVAVRAFNDPDPGAAAHWGGPLSDGSGAGAPCEVSLPDEGSRALRLLSPSVVAHELGHHVTADALGNLFPWDPTDTNHAGFLNPSTTDSWTEGLATFFACLTARDVAHRPRPSLFEVAGWQVDLEVNWRATSGDYSGTTPYSREEFAVAGLLWDLVDPKSDDDHSPITYEAQLFQNLGITLTQPSGPVALRLFADRVEVDAAALWKVLAATGAPNPPAEATRQGYPHVFDVLQLHDALVAAGIGQDVTSLGITALDEIFAAHGFFADTVAQNFCPDPGEPVGPTGHHAFSYSGTGVPARLQRRSPPPMPEPLVEFSAADPSGAPVDLRDFEVTVRFDPPYAAWNHTFTARAVDAGRLHVLLPDATYPVHVSIAARGAAPASAPLELAGEAYHRHLAGKARGPMVRHAFTVVSGAVPKGVTPGGTPAPSSPSSEAAPDEGGGFPWILVGLGVLGALAAILVLRRRRRPGGGATS